MRAPGSSASSTSSHRTTARPSRSRTSPRARSQRRAAPSPIGRSAAASASGRSAATPSRSRRSRRSSGSADTGGLSPRGGPQRAPLQPLREELAKQGARGSPPRGGEGGEGSRERFGDAGANDPGLSTHVFSVACQHGSPPAWPPRAARLSTISSISTELVSGLFDGQPELGAAIREGRLLRPFHSRLHLRGGRLDRAPVHACQLL